MRLASNLRFVSACALSVMLSSSSWAINISVQYAPGTLFYPGIDGTAKAAINAAAADVSDAITSSLNAITTDVYEGTNASTTATFDWSYNYTNPSTGLDTTIDSATASANTVTIFVGTRSLFGTTLGRGGPSGIGLSIGASGFPEESPAAVNNAESLSEAALTRGGGPVIGSLDGTWNWNGYTDNYSIDYGIAYGSLTLDNDSNDNGAADNQAQLDNYWHWNHNTSVGAGKNDLYSIALHEILHAVGIGASKSWNDLTSGTTWNGSEVQAIWGSGNGLISPAGDHVANSVMSTRISDGTPQEVVMDSNITVGTRKELTALDLAFLRDIGYETIIPTVIYDSADYNTDGSVDSSDLAILRNWYGVSAQGDADDDGDTDGSDLLVWQNQYTGGSATSLATVPEPTSLMLLGLAALSLCRLPRS